MAPYRAAAAFLLAGAAVVPALLTSTVAPTDAPASRGASPTGTAHPSRVAPVIGLRVAPPAARVAPAQPDVRVRPAAVAVAAAAPAPRPTAVQPAAAATASRPMAVRPAAAAPAARPAVAAAATRSAVAAPTPRAPQPVHQSAARVAPLASQVAAVRATPCEQWIAGIGHLPLRRYRFVCVDVIRVNGRLEPRAAGVTFHDRPVIELSTRLTRRQLGRVVKHEAVHAYTAENPQVNAALLLWAHPGRRPVGSALAEGGRYASQPAEVFAAAWTRCHGGGSDPVVEDWRMSCPAADAIAAGRVPR